MMRFGDVVWGFNPELGLEDWIQIFSLTIGFRDPIKLFSKLKLLVEYADRNDKIDLNFRLRSWI